MKKHSKFALCLMLLESASRSFGQASIPILKDVTVNSNVALIGNTFVYRYTVMNGIASSGAVGLLSIDISQPIGGAQLDGVGLVNGQGFLQKSSQAILSLASTVPMVPVGIESPVNWRGSLSVTGMATWGAVSEGGLVLSGQSIIGFEISSPGLPSIRDFTAKPYIDVNTLPITPPSDAADLPRYKLDLDAIVNKIIIHGKTIAPTAPAAMFRPADFVKTIQDYGLRALEQGWIKNAGILNSLDQKLTAAVSAIVRGDTDSAKNVLAAFVNEVDAQSGKGLEAEAVALLKFNAQYLISRLP